MIHYAVSISSRFKGSYIHFISIIIPNGSTKCTTFPLIRFSLSFRAFPFFVNTIMYLSMRQTTRFN